jgi:hypothetical protein
MLFSPATFAKRRNVSDHCKGKIQGSKLSMLYKPGWFVLKLSMSSFTKDALGHPISRFYLLEHSIGMILAAILITIGHRASKKETLSDRGKYNRVLMYNSIGFGLVVYLIPCFFMVLINDRTIKPT